MPTIPYTLTKKDVQTITKICTSRFKNIDIASFDEDIYKIINILNNIREYEEYGTFGYAKQIQCDYCVLNSESTDILIYGSNDKKYWLDILIGHPDIYTPEFIITVIQTIIKTIDNSLLNN